jgi:microcystin-dependent protein
MSEPFLAEIRLMSFNFAPKGWAMCNGQLLQINQNQPLFALLGTAFGGNGQTTFALPDYRGRTPIHVGSDHTLGEKAGAQAVTLTIANLPMHTHFFQANSAAGNTPNPVNNLLASANNLYTAPANLTSLEPSTVSNVGGSQAHINMQPFLALTFCIALQGIFPSPN